MSNWISIGYYKTIDGKYMAEKVTVEKFLEMSEHRPVVDVRSPSEFAHARIPSAINIPLFDDSERAKVGTAYNHEGKTAAVLLGLEIVGPKLAGFAKSALSAGSDELMVHCWRGGMRSSSMAWLFETVGLRCFLLEGGYKAYRSHVIEGFAEPVKAVILGGLTGCGKTDILHALEKAGEQVLDLEGLACHRGSAFGTLGQETQPSNEYFENILFDKFRKMDKSKPVWIEDESRNVGKVCVPQALWDQMQAAPMVRIETGRETRIKRLMRDYACFPVSDIEASISKIEKRLGREKCAEAKEACRSGDLEKAAGICLSYYDKFYSSSLARRGAGNGCAVVEMDGLDVEGRIGELIDCGRSFYGIS